MTERSLPDRLAFVGWAPVIRMSARTGSKVGRLPEAIGAVMEARESRIPTGQLNRVTREWVNAHPPPVRKGRRPKIHYVVQAGVAPPTFVLFISGGELGEDYHRFLENRLRDEADFTGTPIHIVSRAGERR